jgi:hypothetical protein
MVHFQNYISTAQPPFKMHTIAFTTCTIQYKLIVACHFIRVLIGLKVEVICQCTESKNRRRSQGVACRCHQVIFFK